MAQRGKVVVAKTVSTRDFVATLAQNAAIFLSLDVNQLGLGINVDAILSAVQITSVENLLWELWFFRSNAGNTGDPDTSVALGYVAFTLAQGLRIGGAGLYQYYVDTLNIALLDAQATGKIHMALINRSAGAKTAGVAGGIRVQLVLEPTAGV